VRIEAKLTPPGNSTLRCSVAQVFSLGRLGTEPYQNRDDKI
jgi:hypothetical protein